MPRSIRAQGGKVSVLYEVSLHALAINTHAPTDEELSAGADPFMLMSVISGIALPFADPTSTGRPLFVPMANFRFQVDSSACAAIGVEMTACGERMPKPSGLEIVRDLSDAEHAAARLRNFRVG